MGNKLIKHFIKDKNCFAIENAYLKPQNVICPFNFRTPSAILSEQFIAIGKVASKHLAKINTFDKKIHIIGVSSRGIHIASAISIELNRIGVKNSLSILKMEGCLEHFCEQCTDGAFTIVVDNSIKRGDTLRRIKKILDKKNIKIDLFFHLYDFYVLNNKSKDKNKLISKETNIPIKPLFNSKDLLKYLKKTNNKDFNLLNKYFYTHGNKKMKKFIKKNTKSVC